MQKVKGVKVTRKVKTVKRKFCIKKKTHTFTIIAMNCVQEQLKRASDDETKNQDHRNSSAQLTASQLNKDGRQ